MKILYYSPHPHLSYTAQTGYGTHMREMVKAFRSRGAEVELLIIGGEGNSTVQPAIRPGVFKRIAKKILPGYIWRSLKEMQLKKVDRLSAEKLDSTIQRVQPDFIYERTAWQSESGSLIAAKHKVPHFCEVNAPFDYEVLQFEGSHSWTEKSGKEIFGSVVRKSTHVFPVSSSLKEYLIKDYDVAASNITVVPNAIDPETVVLDNEQIATIREKYNLQGKTVIGFVGSIFPYHGVDELISAFAVLYRSRKDIALLIVGDGLIIEELTELSRSKGCGEAVHFTGSVPKKNVFNYIDVMDVTVLAKTNWYCSPIKLFEYGYLGKPVIAPDTKAVRDVMNESCGWLIRPGTEDLSEAMSEIISDLPSAKIRARRFAEQIREKHLWNVNAQSVIEVFSKIKSAKG